MRAITMELHRHLLNGGSIFRELEGGQALEVFGEVPLRVLFIFDLAAFGLLAADDQVARQSAIQLLPIIGEIHRRVRGASATNSRDEEGITWILGFIQNFSPEGNHELTVAVG